MANAIDNVNTIYTEWKVHPNYEKILVKMSSNQSANAEEFVSLFSEGDENGRRTVTDDDFCSDRMSVEHHDMGSVAKETMQSDMAEAKTHSEMSDNDSLSSQGNSPKIISMRDGKRCLVKLSLVLHISNQSVDRLSSNPLYTAQVVTVVTSSRHHPSHGCRQDTTDVAVTYDSHGHMALMEVPYIEEGIYGIAFSGEPKPHPVFKMSTTRQARFVWTETLEKIPRESFFMILGKICKVPVPQQKSTCALQQTLLEFLQTTNFREFTLPVLLGYGEPNLWSEIEGCDKVSPVFLPGTPDSHTWKWLNNVDVPSMKTSVVDKDKEVEEPLEIPDTVPFCHYIYRTYIGKCDQQDGVPETQPEADDNVYRAEKSQSSSQESNLCDDCENSSAITSKTKSKSSKSHRRIVFAKRRKGRRGLGLNIKS